MLVSMSTVTLLQILGVEISLTFPKSKNLFGFACSQKREGTVLNHFTPSHQKSNRLTLPNHMEQKNSTVSKEKTATLEQNLTELRITAGF